MWKRRLWKTQKKKNLTKEGKKFKSGSNIPIELRRFYRRKMKVSKKLSKFTNLTIEKVTSYRRELKEIEEKITKYQEETRYKEEKEVWIKLKKNPNYFYQYAKNKARKMEPVGPFATVDGNIIQEEAAFTLNECYKKAFTPRKQETIPTEDWLQDEK